MQLTIESYKSVLEASEQNDESENGRTKIELRQMS